MDKMKLGFGFMRLPLLDEKDQTSIDYKQLEMMVDKFIEQGFTYFDTAYMYHNYVSEIAIREALVKRYPRDAYKVATKLPTMFLKKTEDMERIFNEQLNKVGVTYFDYYLLHNLGRENYQIAEKLNAFDFIQEKKVEGEVKKIGFSYHDSSILLDEILTAHPEVDFVQLQINYADWDNESIQSRKCYEVAVKHGKKVIVMEPVKGGTLAKLPDKAEKLLKDHQPERSVASWAIRFAASHENVMMVLSGMSDYKQLMDNTGFMKDFEPMMDAELELVERVVEIINKEIAVPCTACQYCVEGCPIQIPIPDYFGLLNSKKQVNVEGGSILDVYYSTFSQSNGKASECIECGKCEKSCPQHIEIIEGLKKVAEAFEV